VGISLIRLPEYRLSLALYRGKLDREAFVRFNAELDADDPANRGAWLIYLAPDLDISGVDCTAFPEVKRILKPKIEAMARDGTMRSAIFSRSPDTDLVAAFWRDFVGSDREYVVHPEVFSDVHEALDWLRLPASAYGAVMEAVQGPAAKAGAPAGAEAGRPGGG
jgi:hypothetical protein